MCPPHPRGLGSERRAHRTGQPLRVCVCARMCPAWALAQRGGTGRQGTADGGLPRSLPAGVSFCLWRGAFGATWGCGSACPRAKMRSGEGAAGGGPRVRIEVSSPRDTGPISPLGAGPSGSTEHRALRAPHGVQGGLPLSSPLPHPCRPFPLRTRGGDIAETPNSGGAVKVGAGLRDPGGWGSLGRVLMGR